MITRRSTFAAFAATLATPFAAMAQSTTAPSNSEGTPSGGTGVIGRTQVQPAKPRPKHRTHHRSRTHRTTNH